MAALTITAEPINEPLSLDEAKRHLRRIDNDLDTEIESLIAAARDYCERTTQRTLRVDVERQLTMAAWPSGPIYFPWPPLRSVDAVIYIGEGDDEHDAQTLDDANYHVELSTNGGGQLVWAADADFPAVADRPDAICVMFTTGYETAAAVPETAMQAMKTKLTELFGVGTENELKAAREATQRLLATVDWTGYA